MVSHLTAPLWGAAQLGCETVQIVIIQTVVGECVHCSGKLIHSCLQHNGCLWQNFLLGRHTTFSHNSGLQIITQVTWKSCVSCYINRSGHMWDWQGRKSNPWCEYLMCLRNAWAKILWQYFLLLPIWTFQWPSDGVKPYPQIRALKHWFRNPCRGEVVHINAVYPPLKIWNCIYADPPGRLCI